MWTENVEVLITSLSLIYFSCKCHSILFIYSIQERFRYVESFHYWLIFYRKSVLILFFLCVCEVFTSLGKLSFSLYLWKGKNCILWSFTLSLGNEHFNLFSVITCVITILLSCMCFGMKSQRNNCPQERVFIEDGKTTLITCVKKSLITCVKKSFFTWLQKKKVQKFYMLLCTGKTFPCYQRRIWLKDN